MNIGLNSQR